MYIASKIVRCDLSGRRFNFPNSRVILQYKKSALYLTSSIGVGRAVLGIVTSGVFSLDARNAVLQLAAVHDKVRVLAATAGIYDDYYITFSVALREN